MSHTPAHRGASADARPHEHDGPHTARHAGAAHAARPDDAARAAALTTDTAPIDTASTEVIAAGADGEIILTLDEVNVAASWGHIYGPVSFSVRRGGVTVIVGHGGRGRTALLLTLAGRMKATTGTLTSFGKPDDPHGLFRRAGIGFIDEVDEIVQAIRVRDVVTEQMRWNQRWYKWVAPAQQADLERMCRPVFGDLDLPDIDAMVEELPELTAALFRIAAANARKPEILVVGGVDNLTSIRASEKLLERLVHLGRTQTIITADVNGRRTDLEVRDYIEVLNLTNREFVNMALEEMGTTA